MPEWPMCIFCKKPIDVDAEPYVVPNKAGNGYTIPEKDWQYAHVDCQRKAHGG